MHAGTYPRVGVTAGDQYWEAPTFRVHGHHYALVVCDGLGAGTSTEWAHALPMWLAADEPRRAGGAL